MTINNNQNLAWIISGYNPISDESSGEIPFEAVKPVKERPIVNLECSCCGRETRGRQWWNQDQGYGLCNKCVPSVVGKETDTNTHGKAGIHFSIEA